MYVIKQNNELMHYGILRRSGRYPWGSSSTTESGRSKAFFDYLAEMKGKGMTEAEIARGIGMTTTQLRATKTMANAARKQADINQAEKLRAKGMSTSEIGRRMGRNESSIRSLLADGVKDKNDILRSTADMLRKEVADKEYVDIGGGVENRKGISKEKLATAAAILEGEGYKIHTIQVDQLGTAPGNKTSIKVLAPPGTDYRTVKLNYQKIQQIDAISDDNGRSFYGLLPPKSVSSKRVDVVYADEGGLAKDGLIYVRPGVKDISLGKGTYAQVRILVDGTHYIKGMAMYKDDMPDGVDLQVHSGKTREKAGSKLGALKKISDDPDNPFGAMVKQIGINDPVTGELTKVTSAMNIVNPEGKWDGWKNTLSSQVLSKQSPTLAKNQLDALYEQRKTEFDEIMSLTNPSVRKKLLDGFADGVDSSAVHLEAAALPRQRTQVILPIPSLKDTEVYAPNFRNGESVVLIRYPHGGKFEIPELTVNNNHPDSKRTMGRTTDAIGINPKVASKLSGADFDGDTVLVIPQGSKAGSIATKPSLAGLKNFDPQSAYPAYDGMKTIDGGVYNKATKTVDYGGKQPSSRGKGTQMGLVSNLITDMTIKGATDDELAAAVRHSMVVIDAEKHHLDYRQSSLDNNIPSLYKKYQPREDGRSTGGASTLVSRATSRVDINKRAPRSAAEGGPIDKATGKKVFTDVEPYVNKDGKLVYPQVKSTKLGEANTPAAVRKLSSGTKMEQVYADHSIRLKALADSARKASVNTKDLVHNPAATRAYSKQVKSLEAKLDAAYANRPLERQAQVIANTTVDAKIRANPGMAPDQLKKVKSQSLLAARIRTGATKTDIVIEPDEWEAIQAGAITKTRLKNILDRSDLSRVKELATPRTQLVMSDSKLARAKMMSARGLTQAEIADALGVGLTSLKKSLAGG